MPKTQPAPTTGREPVVTYVYRFWGHDGTLLYVGITTRLEARFKSHQSKPWWPQASHSTIETHPNRALALAAEATAILFESPRHNIARPDLARVNQLQARAYGLPGAEVAPYEPMAVIGRAHDRIDGLEADLRKVRAELTSAKAELALASKSLKDRDAPGSPSRYQQSVIEHLRDQLEVAVAMERAAVVRAEKAERSLAAEKLRRMVVEGRRG